MASIALIMFGMGTRSAGSSPSGRRLPEAMTGGICGGTWGGTGLGSFIGQWRGWFDSVVENLQQCLENIFVKISVQGRGAEKLHGQTGRPDERTQNPRKLAAQKQIARQPC